MSIGPDVPHQIGLFFAFQHTLLSVCLSNCSLTSSALIAIINYFPLLENLDLQSLKYEDNCGPIPQLSWPLRDRLVITECRGGD